MANDHDVTKAPAGNGQLPSGLKEFGHYTLQSELGRGAQGVVYLASDTRLGRKVALKMLTAAGAVSQNTRDRFQREAEATSKLDHPNICALYEMGEEHGIPYIAMQHIRGTTLSGVLDDARSTHEIDQSVCDISISLTAAAHGAQTEAESESRAVSRPVKAGDNPSRAEMADVVQLTPM